VARYVALLRAVNVVGRKKVAMPVLRELLGGLGYTDVATYLQSGNAVFTAPERPTARIAAQIEDRLSRDLGLTTDLIVRTADELCGVIDRNPLPVGDPSKFLVLFIAEPPPPGWLDAFDPGAYPPEEMAPGERELYLSLPNGIGRAKLPVSLPRRLSSPSTARNWRTVLALQQLADGG
jgi:uncharacterized protein (DUF1697 family)